MFALLYLNKICSGPFSPTLAWYWFKDFAEDEIDSIGIIIQYGLVVWIVFMANHSQQLDCES